MGPKQTTPQGKTPVGGQEGQTGPATTKAGAVSGASSPVFSFTGTSATSGSPLGGPSVTSPNEPGTLGADTLSTGANVSRTMDSLNNREQSTHGGLAFAKHRFDKIDPKTGDILLTPDTPKKSGFFSSLFGRRKAAQPESVSMVENRHKDAVIPEEYQNPGRKKRGEAAAQPAPAPAAPADPVVPATPAASTQPAAPAQPMPAPAQPALASSTQPAPQAAPASQPAAPKKSRKGIIIALTGVAVVAVAIVAVVLVSNVMNSGSNKSGNKGGSGTSSNQSQNYPEIITNKLVLAKLEEQKENTNWLEKIIESMYSSQLCYYEYRSINNDINTSIADLESLETYMSQNGIQPDNSDFAAIFSERLKSYKELVTTINNFIGYQESDEKLSQQFNEYLEDKSSALYPYASQFKQDVDNGMYVSKGDEGKYILWCGNGELLSGIANAVTPPIDYETDGYIFEMINQLIIDGAQNNG